MTVCVSEVTPRAFKFVQRNCESQIAQAYDARGSPFAENAVCETDILLRGPP